MKQITLFALIFLASACAPVQVTVTPKAGMATPEAVAALSQEPMCFDQEWLAANGVHAAEVPVRLFDST
jgi:hypothetical protein